VDVAAALLLTIFLQVVVFQVCKREVVVELTMALTGAAWQEEMDLTPAIVQARLVHLVS
jgi:hypothetical protein